MSYYIKTIWGPNGDRYIEGRLIGFPIKCKNVSEKFKNCDGFVIYETGRKENGRRGSMAVFAVGEISDDQTNLPENELKWGWHARINIIKSIAPKDGVGVKRLREFGINQFQIQGGLIPITKNQFDNIVEELNTE